MSKEGCISKSIKRVICIGANCIAADIMYSVGLRIPGPVDNISGFNIWKSHLLFNRGLYKALFKETYDVRPSTKFEKNNFYYEDKVYSFNHNFHIVHNDFESIDYQKAIKKRLKLFKVFYKMSIEDNSLWYIYSLDKEDENIDEKFLLQILDTLPDCCKSRLICLGMRAKNKIFGKYFKYYLEFDEKDYKWHDKKSAFEIIKLLEDSFDLKFDFS